MLTAPALRADSLKPKTSTDLTINDYTSGLGISVENKSGRLLTKNIDVGGGRMRLTSAPTDWTWSSSDRHSSITGGAAKIATFTTSTANRMVKGNVEFTKGTRFYFDVHITAGDANPGKFIGICDGANSNYNATGDFTGATFAATNTGTYGWINLNSSWRYIYINGVSDGVQYLTTWADHVCRSRAQ